MKGQPIKSEHNQRVYRLPKKTDPGDARVMQGI